MRPPTEGELRRAESANWGPWPAASVERPRMNVVGWKPLVKGTFHGFASVELPIGLNGLNTLSALKVFDCPVSVGPKGPWASLASKFVLDREGRQARPNGKPRFAPVLECRNRELADRFSTAIVALIRAAHPDALDDGG
jgi:hypothetical protein